jgi:hypothetical protein
MKLLINFRVITLVLLSLFGAVLLNGCTNDAPGGGEGYTGEIKDSSAKKLVNTCHFISKADIADWVSRYKKDSTGKITIQNQSAFSYLLNNSISFNSCIIRKLINDANSIGLRVIYGKSPDNQIHIILVGINPDYSNLYIKAEKECCDQNTLKKLGAQADGLSDGEFGGAEFGQMP